MPDDPKMGSVKPFGGRRKIADRDLAVLLLLAKSGAIATGVVAKLRKALAASDLPLVEFLLRRCLVADDDWRLPGALADHYKLRVLDKKPECIDPEVVRRMPAAFSRLHRLVFTGDGYSAIAAEDPMLVPVDTILAMRCTTDLTVRLATRSLIRQVQDRVFGPAGNRFPVPRPDAPWRRNSETLDLWSDSTALVEDALIRASARSLTTYSTDPVATTTITRRTPRDTADVTVTNRHLRVVRGEQDEED